MITNPLAMPAPDQPDPNRPELVSLLLQTQGDCLLQTGASPSIEAVKAMIDGIVWPTPLIAGERRMTAASPLPTS